MDFISLNLLKTLHFTLKMKNIVKNQKFHEKLNIYPGACIRPMFMQFVVTRKRKSKSQRGSTKG